MSNNNISSHNKKEILVLYGSQTGNSEAAAIQISNAIPDKFKSDGYSSRHMQLDDFLEYEKCKWSPIVIIVTSSYGVGQAPLGAYRFREFCDAINEDDGSKKFLSGLKYALLGLGDSKYTTFFQNPTKVDEALRKAGATRIGEVGKADASGPQLEIIDAWIGKLWNVLKQECDQELSLPQEAIDQSWNLCVKLFPHFAPTNQNSSHQNLMMAALFAIIIYLSVTIIMQKLPNDS